jgi:2-phosphoglycerate kinase
MRPILWILLGALLMFVVLKIVSAKSVSPSGTSAAFKQLAKTQQMTNLIKTNEFRELMRTNQFKDLVKTLAEDQLVAMSKTLVGTTTFK